MRRLIPPRTKIESTIIKGFTFKDLIIAVIYIVFIALCISSKMLGFFRIIFSVVVLIAMVITLIPWGYARGYTWLNIIRRYVFAPKKYTSEQTKALINYDISENALNLYGNFASVLEITPIEFLLFKKSKQIEIINSFANALRYIGTASIVKIEKPIRFNIYVSRYEKLLNEIETERNNFISQSQQDAIKQHKAFKQTELNLDKFNKRIEILEKAISFLSYNDKQKKIRAEVFYVILYQNNREKLKQQEKDCISKFNNFGINPQKLNNEQIKEFLSFYFFDKEPEADKPLPFPEIKVKNDRLYVDNNKINIATIGKYPVFADGEAWATPLFNIQSTKCVMNISSANKEVVIKSINKAIKEIRFRYISEKEISNKQELEIQNEALMALLQQFQLGNEAIHNVNFYIQYSDEQSSAVKQKFQAQGFILNHLKFRQMEGYLSMLPMVSKELITDLSRQIQGNTLAASFPFVNNIFMDKKGDYLGEFRYPVFFDLWERAPVNKNRVNSNMVVMGQSGTGKTYTQKKILMQQRVAGTKVFVLDCEHEYEYMANQLGGQSIEMTGGATRLNPFHVYPSLDKDTDDDSVAFMGDVTAQRTFLSEWFKSLLPMEIDTKALLENCIKELYESKKIYDTTDLRKFKAKDFPTFDDLYALITAKTKNKNTQNYEMQNLLKLQNYIKMFSEGGIYARLWNGHSTMDINNDFIVFDFQKLFADSNTEVCNAQMMLLMRLLMREVIKIKDNNAINDTDTRVIIMIDEAHRYISQRFPSALDTMEQLARRIRKYNGGLIVATQSFSDFLGTTQEMQTKASAVINNCQYSMVFGLKADEINKVQQLYANYGGGLTPDELDFLTKAERGQMLFLVEPEKRSVVQIRLLPDEGNYIEKPKIS